MEINHIIIMLPANLDCYRILIILCLCGRKDKFDIVASVVIVQLMHLSKRYLGTIKSDEMKNASKNSGRFLKCRY